MPCKCFSGKSLCVPVWQLFTYSPHLKGNVFSPRPSSNTAPGCLFVLWSCLRTYSCSSLCFWFFSHRKDSSHPAPHLHLNVHRFYPSDFPHGSGMQIHTDDSTYDTTGHHIHIFAYIHEYTHANHPPTHTAFFCLHVWCGPLKRAKQ